MSLVKSVSRKASSLKLTMKTSSCGLESFTSASAAASTLARLSRMLPLLSIDQAHRDRHIFALEDLDRLLHAVFENLESGLGRLVTRWPLLSTTVACKTTSRVSDANDGGLLGGSACRLAQQARIAASGAQRRSQEFSY